MSKPSPQTTVSPSLQLSAAATTVAIDHASTPVPVGDDDHSDTGSPDVRQDEYRNSSSETDETLVSAADTQPELPATSDSSVVVECPDRPDMPKNEGMEGGLASLRLRHNMQDAGSSADNSMKHGQMSPTTYPTTPDKNMSHSGTPDLAVTNSANKHSKRESYKAQKRTYRSQKKEAAKELLSTITDPAVVLLGDWLKVRGTLKSWTKLWCVLKPGVLVLYKSDKHKGSQWVGTILLNTCQLLERPSKKDGFCFKLFHPLDQSIWATKGPKGETIGAFIQPLPYSYCIFRAPSESAGKCWMDALELALKCTNLLKRSMTRLDNVADTSADLDHELSRNQGTPWRPHSHGDEYRGNHNGGDHLHDGDSDVFSHTYNSMRAQERSMNESDLEKHFANQGDDPASHSAMKKDLGVECHDCDLAKKDSLLIVTLSKSPEEGQKHKQFTLPETLDTATLPTSKTSDGCHNPFMQSDDSSTLKSTHKTEECSEHVESSKAREELDMQQESPQLCFIPEIGSTEAPFLFVPNIGHDEEDTLFVNIDEIAPINHLDCNIAYYITPAAEENLGFTGKSKMSDNKRETVGMPYVLNLDPQTLVLSKPGIETLPPQNPVQFNDSGTRWKLVPVKVVEGLNSTTEIPTFQGTDQESSTFKSTSLSSDSLAVILLTANSDFDLPYTCFGMGSHHISCRSKTCCEQRDYSELDRFLQGHNCSAGVSLGSSIYKVDEFEHDSDRDELKLEAETKKLYNAGAAVDQKFSCCSLDQMRAGESCYGKVEGPIPGFNYQYRSSPTTPECRGLRGTASQVIDQNSSPCFYTAKLCYREGNVSGFYEHANIEKLSRLQRPVDMQTPHLNSADTLSSESIFESPPDPLRASDNSQPSTGHSYSAASKNLSQQKTNVDEHDQLLMRCGSNDTMSSLLVIVEESPPLTGRISGYKPSSVYSERDKEIIYNHRDNGTNSTEKDKKGSRNMIPTREDYLPRRNIVAEDGRRTEKGEIIQNKKRDEKDREQSKCLERERSRHREQSRCTDLEQRRDREKSRCIDRKQSRCRDLEQSQCRDKEQSRFRLFSHIGEGQANNMKQTEVASLLCKLSCNNLEYTAVDQEKFRKGWSPVEQEKSDHSKFLEQRFSQTGTENEATQNKGSGAEKTKGDNLGNCYLHLTDFISSKTVLDIFVPGTILGVADNKPDTCKKMTAQVDSKQNMNGQHVLSREPGIPSDDNQEVTETLTGCTSEPVTFPSGLVDIKSELSPSDLLKNCLKSSHSGNKNTLLDPETGDHWRTKVIPVDDLSQYEIPCLYPRSGFHEEEPKTDGIVHTVPNIHKPDICHTWLSPYSAKPKPVTRSDKHSNRSNKELPLETCKTESLTNTSGGICPRKAATSQCSGLQHQTAVTPIPSRTSPVMSMSSSVQQISQREATAISIEQASEFSPGLDDDKSEREDTESSQSELDEDTLPGHMVIAPPEETNYTINNREELGQSGDDCQTEEVTDENKGLIWTLVKQVRPGMDLSKVVLPTFILEPRSFLDKLSDYYYHADILSGAVLEESPYSRMKSVVRWYLSGFYKKPKGLKKPYNPVIGETFRCCWHHPATGSRTFYIAEQVSHHPPISVFHVTNRKDGFNISGSILARSKFYGNSLSAILDGVATLSFLERGEDYFITMPYAHCKGILIGTLTMELGGKVTINCPKTGYKCELEFKLKPFLGSGQASNRIHGKIMMGSDVLAMIDGHWDQEIYIKDRALDKKRDIFWTPTPEIRAARLKRFTVPITDQHQYESERLWEAVSKAVTTCDMQAATNEKYAIEEEQRKGARERKLNKTEWVPRYFEKDFLNGGDWIYKHADDRPWDPVNDVYQYEHNFVVQTQTRHKTPHVRANSLSSLTKSVEKKKLHIPHTVEESDSSGHGLHRESDSSDYVGSRNTGKVVKLTQEGMALMFDPLVKMQEETTQALRSLQQQVVRLEMQHAGSAGGGGGQSLLSKDWVTLAIILIFQIILQWIFRTDRA